MFIILEEMYSSIANKGSYQKLLFNSLFNKILDQLERYLDGDGQFSLVSSS